ncbi:MAG: hypothetical protein ABGZ35_17055 [Planctomycetaceae bacterium]
MTLNGKSRIAVAWLTATGLCGYFEFQRLLQARASPAGSMAWFTNWDPETTLPFLVLLALPVMCLFPGSLRTAFQINTLPNASLRTRLACCALVFGVSLAASSIVGLQSVKLPNGLRPESVAFYELPPAYHDEYSYLLQARTFAAGRLSWPPAAIRPDLFHQYHVLNERCTASRYFPWTGLWIAMFLETGRPIVGHWLAGALAAAFFYLTASEVLAPKPALAAGLLIGCSPGLAVFSNMLLAHHPTMLALSVFLWTMVRLIRSPSLPLTLISGTALSLAMLGRPMTAAGFALPWGLMFFRQLMRSTKPAWAAQRITLTVCMALPLAAGFLALGILNHNITGSAVRSGYQEYTRIYTPRHTYGFNNGVRGDAQQTPKVLKSYDQWAENLTWPRALRNLGDRCLASGQWILGIAPIVMGLILVLMRLVFATKDSPYQTTVLRLMFASVVTLHLAHIPYWFSGIMHWHYVFETAPLILILVAAGMSSIVDELSRLTSTRASRAWLTCFVIAALLPAWYSAEPVWGPSKIVGATSELAWSRRRFEVFHQLVASDTVKKPALVLVDESNSDPQLSYIINDPEYRNEVLVARLPETGEEIRQLQLNFPERNLYRFDPQTFGMTPIQVK